MSIWSHDPEWFDEWIERQALSGRFGPEIQSAVENDDLPGYELWIRKDFDPKGNLGAEAMGDYFERFVR